MLQDGYKSSHSSLKSFEDENEQKEKETSRQEDTLKRKEPSNEEDTEKSQPPPSGAKKSEIRSVVIQVPVKRHKISTPFTPREVIDGTCRVGLDRILPYSLALLTVAVVSNSFKQ